MGTEKVTFAFYVFAGIGVFDSFRFSCCSGWNSPTEAGTSMCLGRKDPVIILPRRESTASSTYSIGTDKSRNESLCKGDYNIYLNRKAQSQIRCEQTHTFSYTCSFCNGFSWDSDGDILAIISQSNQLVLWDSNALKKQTVDVGLRDVLSFITWSKKDPILAVGTVKGNVSMFNYGTSRYCSLFDDGVASFYIAIYRRIPVIGKHAKRVTCGAWNAENLLALGSEDKTISISNTDGDTLRVIVLRSEPMEVQFSDMKQDERIGGENTVSHGNNRYTKRAMICSR